MSHATSNIDDCKVIELPRHLNPNGSLTEMENTGAFPFNVKRVYYLYDVPVDSVRGGHSHHATQQLVIAVSGSFEVTLNDGHRSKTFTLSRPYEALYITGGIWRTLQNFSAGAVCLVLASRKYEPEDYVRDYNEFLRLTAVKEPGVKQYPFLDLAICDAPYIDEIRNAVMNVIESGRYIGGPVVEGLEYDLCQLTGAEYAVGVSNGLDALRLIFRALKQLGRLKDGDEVIVPANTFVASVLAITDNGLIPVFVDPDEETMNLDTSLLEKAVTERTRAILTVHLYGQPCWDETMKEVAQRHQLIVVEDNAQAIGAEARCEGIGGSRVTGALGHAAAFSFYPTKNIGAIGDAGAVTTDDEELAHTVRALANYGSDRRYHNIYEGLNCRLDPIQAAVLRTKLLHIDTEMEHRRELAGIYNREIRNPEVRLPLCEEGAENSVWHQYVVRVADRKGFRDYLASRGVQTDVHYPVPPHKQPCYSRYADAPLPVACSMAEEVVSLPISRCTSAADAREIARIINDYRK